MAFSTGMSPLLVVAGTGLLTIGYQGLFDLAKQFLDPYDNESYGRGEDPLCVDTLIAETNAGSIRWLYGFEEMPFSSQRLNDGELYEYLLPVRGYSVEEIEQMEAERIERERQLDEQRKREEEEAAVAEAERLRKEAEEAEMEKEMVAKEGAAKDGGEDDNNYTDDGNTIKKILKESALPTIVETATITNTPTPETTARVEITAIDENKTISEEEEQAHSSSPEIVQ